MNTRVCRRKGGTYFSKKNLLRGAKIKNLNKKKSLLHTPPGWIHTPPGLTWLIGLIGLIGLEKQHNKTNATCRQVFQKICFFSYSVQRNSWINHNDFLFVLCLCFCLFVCCFMFVVFFCVFLFVYFRV